MAVIKIILSILGLFCGISSANVSRPELIFGKGSLTFFKVTEYLGMVNSSVAESLKWDQMIFSFDVDNDGEVDAVALVSQSIGPRSISIHTYLDRYGRQRLVSVIEPRAINMTALTFIRTEDGKWISDEADQNYAVWMAGLLSFVNDVGGAKKYLKIQTEFLRELLEYYKKAN